MPAVIICPGGSYHHLGMKHEGYQVAQWFAQKGYAAFVLRYRVSSHGAHHPDMIQDLQLTIALIKKFGNELIDTTKIGAIGFSAGGHLVLHSGIEKHNYIKNEFPSSEKYGLRPNYIMAIYPVVSMEDSIAHQKSRKNLLTKKYTQDDIHKFSIEQNIPDDMPPTFVLACTDDDVVDVRNSRALWQSLKEKNINMQEVADKLIKDGYNAESLHGDLSQQQRDLTMQKFRQHTVQLLVATDVAARGLDVDDLTHVINYGLPDDIENYTHRSGRTGRAGKKGTSICIVHSREKFKIRNIEKVIGKEFEKGGIPSAEEICKKKSARSSSTR